MWQTDNAKYLDNIVKTKLILISLNTLNIMKPVKEVSILQLNCNVK